MRRTCYETLMVEMINALLTVIENSEGNRPFAGLWCRWESDKKMNIKEIKCVVCNGFIWRNVLIRAWIN